LFGHAIEQSISCLDQAAIGLAAIRSIKINQHGEIICDRVEAEQYPHIIAAAEGSHAINQAIACLEEIAGRRGAIGAIEIHKHGVNTVIRLITEDDSIACRAAGFCHSIEFGIRIALHQAANRGSAGRGVKRIYRPESGSVAIDFKDISKIIGPSALGHSIKQRTCSREAVNSE